MPETFVSEMEIQTLPWVAETSVALEGFGHLIPFAAGHEIIRQGRRDLTVCRMTPDILTDQMLAAGCVSRLVASFFASGSAGRRTSSGQLARFPARSALTFNLCPLGHRNRMPIARPPRGRTPRREP